MHSIDFSTAHLAATPWAIAPSARDHAIEALTHPNAARRPGPGASRGAGRGRPSGRTALIPVIGILTQHRTLLEDFGLSTSCDSVSRALRAALADPGIDRIVMDVDSSGGSVFGIGELAGEIRGARATKPITAVANSMAASAAYWLASACSEVYVTPSGTVGSIGVIAAHEDVAGALELAGVSITLITAGKYKAEGSPYGPLDAEGRGAMQSDVDLYYRDFTADVAKGRNVSVDAVRRNMGQGRMLRGDAAMAAGMIDGIATLSDVLAGRARSPKAAISAATLARLPVALARSLRELALLN